MTESAEIKKPHEWTNQDGEVLVLRFANRDGTSDGRDGRPVFRHPMKVGEVVTAPDWKASAQCGNGIHGWPLGLGVGDGKEAEWTELWQVYGALPADIIGEIEGGQKCKFRQGTLRMLGSWHEAMLFVLAEQMAWVHYAARGAASATGGRGAASATGESGAASATGGSGAASATGGSGAASATGGRGAASATGGRGAASATGGRGAASATGGRGAASATGGRGAASATGGSGAASATGERGAASATGWSGAASATGWSGAASATGWRGAASATGERGAASATGESGAASATGWRGAASATGSCSAAVVTNLGGRARSGKHGCIALAWWNHKASRAEMRIALTGSSDQAALKPNTWYVLDAAGNFIEDSNQLPEVNVR